MEFDFFISHASEDKDDFVRPLVEALIKRGATVFYDEYSLHVGDNLRRSIDGGLSQSRFGIVVLSPSFFAKNWPQWELDGLVTRQIASDRPVIVPLWHQVGHAQIAAESPPLANVLGISTDEPVDQIADKIIAVARSTSGQP